MAKKNEAAKAAEAAEAAKAAEAADNQKPADTQGCPMSLIKSRPVQGFENDMPKDMEKTECETEAMVSPKGWPHLFVHVKNERSDKYRIELNNPLAERLIKEGLASVVPSFKNGEPVIGEDGKQEEQLVSSVSFISRKNGRTIFG